MSMPNEIDIRNNMSKATQAARNAMRDAGLYSEDANFLSSRAFANLVQYYLDNIPSIEKNPEVLHG